MFFLGAYVRGPFWLEGVTESRGGGFWYPYERGGGGGTGGGDPSRCLVLHPYFSVPAV